jgi:protein-disulfide isomerase
LGNPNAPVKIVEFGDFKCPACAMWEQSVFPSLLKDYIQSGKVQFYFINFPFLGQDSILSAMAGEDIYSLNPDAFWEFYAKIYLNQGPETEQWATQDFLLKFVKENVSGIDYKKFETLLKEEKNMDTVRKDFLIGQKYGVNSTPSFFVNGVKMDDNRLPAIQSEIEKDLKGVK